MTIFVTVNYFKHEIQLIIMNIPPFPATIEKDGRIMIPKLIRNKFELESNEFIMVLVGKYKDIEEDFIMKAFNKAIL